MSSIANWRTDAVPPLFSMKGGSHILEIHTPAFFPNNRQVLWFSGWYAKIWPFKHGECILTASNITVTYCSPSVQYERRLTHHSNSYWWLLSPQQISPVIFRLISLNLKIKTGGTHPDSFKYYCQILFPLCSVWKQAHTSFKFMFLTSFPITDKSYH